jgi:hypothetical protein
MLVHEISNLWVPTHPPSLNFCSSSSKAKPEPMQEMQGNTNVDTCLNLPNKLMWSYLAVPTHLMELSWNFSPCLGRLKDETFRLCLSYLATFWKSIGENMIAMILWFLNIRHSYTLFGMWFLTLAQQLLLLILPSICWICGAHGYEERVQLRSCILPS